MGLQIYQFPTRLMQYALPAHLQVVIFAAKEKSMAERPETAREIVESLPQRFEPLIAENAESIVHLRLKGDRGGDFTVIVEDGNCTVKEGLHGEAACVVSTTDKAYEDLETGRTNAQMAVFTGKVKVSNIPELLRFIQYFKRIGQ